mmetsp:Transcript_66182/g.158304  ORF Transcript_66182/g.158304 Transcript_66182/m.158304 type:complete len:357 (-) Transcript_66182:101-1171(-)
MGSSKPNKARLKHKVGASVLYLSRSKNAWIPAKVIGTDLEEGIYKLDVVQEATPDRVKAAVAPDFAVGSRVLYLSRSENRWIQAVVEAFDPGSGLYALDVNAGVPPDRIRADDDAPEPEPTYPVGSKVQYWSRSKGKWLIAKVTGFDATKGTYNLNMQPFAPADRLRPADAEGNDPPPPPRSKKAAAAAAAATPSAGRGEDEGRSRSPRRAAKDDPPEDDMGDDWWWYMPSARFGGMSLAELFGKGKGKGKGMFSDMDEGSGGQDYYSREYEYDYDYDHGSWWKGKGKGKGKKGKSGGKGGKKGKSFKGWGKSYSRQREDGDRGGDATLSKLDDQLEHYMEDRKKMNAAGRDDEDR